MKKILKNKYVLVVVVLLVGVLIGWLIKPSGESNSDKNGTNNEEKEQIWTCSMHPQIKRNEPGDCPICGMELIPLESAKNDILDPNAIQMSPTAMKIANVQTRKVGDDLSDKFIRLNGKIQVDERLRNTQSSHIPGRIEKLLVNFTGEYVKKGQILAYVYSPELVSTQEELLEAQKVKESQPQLFESAKNKLRNWKISENQIDKVLDQKKPVESFPIRADFSGYVTKLLSAQGDYIKQGQSIYEIADLSNVWVMFDVYESDLQWVNEGDFVEYTVASIPGKTYSGKISYLDPVINQKTRVAKARLEAVNKDLKLKPEMFVSGTIKSKIENKENQLIIPKSAIMWTGKRSVVYVKNETENMVSFKMREIELGLGLGDSYVVESGLSPGEEIAVHGTFSIDAAAQLAGKPSMMNPEGGVVNTGHNHGGSSGKKTSINHNSHTTKIEVSSTVKRELIPLLSNYLDLKDALTQDNLETAHSAIKKMSSTLSKINMGIFKGEAHNVWMQHSSQLEKELSRAVESQNLESLRNVFKSISEQIIMIFKTFGSPNDTLFVEFCPMANDNRGANWLSKSKEIKNPYFGSSMLKCGEVKDEIK